MSNKNYSGKGEFFMHPVRSELVEDGTGNLIGDKALTAQTWRDFNGKLFSNGIISTDGEMNENDLALKVTPGNGIQVRVNAGSATALGGQVLTQKIGPIIVNLEDSSAVDRTDLIVLRIDYENERDAYVYAKSNYQDGSLERTPTIHELGLASVLVKADSTAIVQEDITDLRSDADMCGWSYDVLNKYRLDSHENRLDGHDSDISGLSAEVGALDGRLTTAESVISTHTSELANHESRLDMIEPIISTHTTELSTHETRLDTAEASILTHTSEIAGHENRLDTLEPTVSTHTSQISGHETRITAIESENATQNANIDSLELEIDSLDTRVTTAETNIVAVETSLVAHTANVANPHAVTKAQVGLSNVENTTDLDKPISTATQVALDTKAEIVHTHVTSDVTDLQPILDGKASIVHTHAIADVTNLQSALDGKLDKSGGAMTGDLDADGHKIIDAHMGNIQLMDNFSRITLQTDGFIKGEANQRIRIDFMPIARFSGEMRVKVLGSESHISTCGIVEKTFGILLDASTSWSVSTESYTSIEGIISDNIAISGIDYDDVAGTYYVVVQHLLETAQCTSMAIVLEFEGSNVPAVNELKAMTVSPRYIGTDAELPVPVLQTRGAKIWTEDNDGAGSGLDADLHGGQPLGSMEYIKSIADPTSGILVSFGTTHSALYSQFTAEITGSAYNVGGPISTRLEFKHYTPAGDFRYYKQTNMGHELPPCKLMLIDGILNLWVPVDGDQQTFNFTIRRAGANITKDLTFTSSAEPVTLPRKEPKSGLDTDGEINNDVIGDIEQQVVTNKVVFPVINTAKGSATDFTKRVDLIGQVQAVSYAHSVVALCELNPGYNSYSVGTLTFKRDSGLYPPVVLDVSFAKQYDTEVAFYHMENKGFDPNSLKACTFMYNGKKYGGIQIYPANAPFQYVEFYGTTNSPIFGVDYFNDQTSTPIDIEINDSIEFETPIPNSTFNFNDNAVYHTGNLVPATPTSDGLLLASDKAKLDSLPLKAVSNLDQLPDMLKVIEALQADVAELKARL